MQVIVIATDEQRAGLLAQPADADIAFHWLSGMDSPAINAPDACIDLQFEHTPERITWLRQLNCPLIVINAVVTPLSEIGEGFVRFNGWNTFLQRNVAEASCNDELIRQKAERLFSRLGRTTEWTQDIPGFITPRVVASIINEAFFALEEGVSAEQEIDTAMKLGTNYPYGPFEWGQKIGLKQVYNLLEMLGREQKRYKPCQLMKETTLV